MRTQFISANKIQFRWGVFCLSLLIMSVPAFASTLVEPGKFILVIKPGERMTDTINVKNVSDKTTVVKAAVYDWTLNDGISWSLQLWEAERTA
jgi:P pilus assembly chaperone PapD